MVSKDQTEDAGASVACDVYRGFPGDVSRNAGKHFIKAMIPWVRCVPIVLVAVFGGTALILCNPGYFWDDWMWISQRPEESIRIGKELGVFWGGYLTNAINALPQPALTMRGLALLAWVMASAALAYLLYRQRKLSRHHAFEVFLLCAATHLAPVRFLTSVAMYNVYIACFWIGCALLLIPGKPSRARLWSVPFFFFSFYLNSQIALYLCLLALLAGRDLLGHISWPASAPHWRELIRRPRELPRLAAPLSATLPQVRARLRRFALENVSLIALPFAFAILKRLTAVRSNLYGDYNHIDHRLLLSAILKSFVSIRPILRDFFAIASRGVQPLVLLICTLLCFLLLRLAPRAGQRASLRTALMQLALGWAIFAAAAYPYILVGKNPDLTSFYDSRNVHPAIPGLTLVLLALTNVLDRGFARVIVLRRIGRELLLGYVLGVCVSSSFTSGLDLWRDWMRQTAIMTFIRTHELQLKTVRTFVFDDSAYRIGDRILWNYEYSGNLHAVYGTRERFGISVDEYDKWPPKVQLLIDPLFRRRFNLDDYRIDRPHAILTVRKGLIPLNTPRVLSTVRAYLCGKAWADDLPKYVSVRMAYEFIQADQRVAEIFEIANALNAYRRDHGYYPPTSAPPQGPVPTHELAPTERIGPPIVNGDIPGLFPKYLPRINAMKFHGDGSPTYLYASDGLDFKLVYANPPDLAYAKQAHPALIDPMRDAYGTWTLGAMHW